MYLITLAASLFVIYFIIKATRKKWLDAAVDDAKFKVNEIEENYESVKDINTDIVKKHKTKIDKVTDLEI